MLLIPALSLILSAPTHDSILSQAVQNPEIPIIRNESGPVCDGPVFDLIPERVIGKDSGRPEWQIFPRGVGIQAVGPGDRLYILTSDGITYISNNRGRLLGQFGGLGEGPGEYSESTTLFWIESDGEYWLYDYGLYRMTRYSLDGEVLGMTGLHEMSDDWRILLHLKDRTFLGYRNKFIDGQPFQVYGMLDEGLNWDREVLTIRHPDPASRGMRLNSGRLQSFPFLPAYPFVESFPDGRFVLINPEEGSLTYYSLEGTPHFKVQDCFEFPKVTREDRDRFLARIEARRPGDLPEARRIRFPNTMGAFEKAYIDDSGRLWLQQQKCIYNADGDPVAYKYFIVDREGRLLGTQTFEFEATSIEISGDLLYWTDMGGEDIGPRIRVYRLEPRYH